MQQLRVEKRGAKAACPHTWPNGELLPQSPSQGIWAHWLFTRVVFNIVVSYVSTGRFLQFRPESPLRIKWGKWGLERRGKLGLVAHTCNPSLQQAQSEDCWEFELGLVNTVSSGTAPHYNETLFQEHFPSSPIKGTMGAGAQRFISVAEHLCYISKVRFPVSSKENRKQAKEEWVVWHRAMRVEQRPKRVWFGTLLTGLLWAAWDMGRLGTTYSNLNITEASSVSGRYGDLFYRLFHLNSCTTIL